MPSYTSPVTGKTYEGEHQFYAPNNPVSALTDWLTKDMRRMSDEFWSDDVSRQEFTNRYGLPGYPLGFIGGVFSRPINKAANQQELDFQDYLELGLTATATPLGQFLYRSGKIAADPALQAFADSKAGSAIGAALDDLYARTMDFLHSPAPMLRDKVHKHDPSRREAMRNVGLGTAAAIIGAPAISTIVKKGAPLVGEFAKDAATIAHAPLASAATHASTGAELRHWGGWDIAEGLIEKSSGKKAQTSVMLDERGWREGEFALDAFKHPNSRDGYKTLFEEAGNYSDFLDWAAKRKGIERTSTKQAESHPELLSDSLHDIGPQERGGRLDWRETQDYLESLDSELLDESYLQRATKQAEEGTLDPEEWHEMRMQGWFDEPRIDDWYPEMADLKVVDEDGVLDAPATMARYLKAEADEQADIMARDTKRIFQSDDDLAKEMAAYWKETEADYFRLSDEINSLLPEINRFKASIPPEEIKGDLRLSRVKLSHREKELRAMEYRLRELELKRIQANQRMDWVENWANGQRDASGNQVGGLRKHFGWDKFKTYTEAKEQIPEDLLPLYENI